MKKRIVLSILAGVMLLSAPTMIYAAEETAAEETTETGADLTLSDDIYSFQFALDGEIYQLPMSYAEFCEKGWEEVDDPSDVEPNQYLMQRFRKGDLVVYVDLINLTINTIPSSECSVAGFDIEQYYVEDAPETKFELPKGIAFGFSTYDDVVAAYGTPSDEYEGDLYRELTYEYDYYQEVEITIGNETNVIEEISLRNFIADEEANANAAAEVSSDPTEAVLAYEAPTELGDDLSAFIVEYAGDLYQLPAPVSVFLENGWKIKESESDAVIPGKSTGRIVMMKDNQDYTAYVANYDANAVTNNNAFVECVGSSDYSTNLSMNLPKGISMYMTEEELLAAIEGIEYEITDNSDYSTIYRIQIDPDNFYSSYEIIVSKETGTVTEIEVENSPR